MTTHIRWADWLRLDRFVRGDGTRHEREAIRRWLDSDIVVFVLAMAMRTVARPSPRVFDTDAAWYRVRARLGRK
jgi:hypothetical protein